MTVFPDCQETVSYTHLDVYKRQYLDGEYPLEEAVRILKRDTRHFAKRQLTWFRREKDTIWMNKDEFDYNEDRILEMCIRDRFKTFR